MKTISVIGLGNRGTEYMSFVKYLHRREAVTVAICDVSEVALDEVGKRFKIAPNMRFRGADAFFAKGVLSDGLIISTQDKSHYAITRAALETGYKYILLEKPVSDDISECQTLVRLAAEKGAVVLVCHVLRYADYYRKIAEILRSGELGELLHIDHTENVGYFHFAHSYVRGNWKRSEDSTPSLLAKCCHDIDLLRWFAASECTKVSSVGKLAYFNRAHAPEGATEFCLGGCKQKRNCPYDAEYTYITCPLHKATFVKFMRRTMTGKMHATKADMYKLLRSSDYGKCVYLSDNDVCDIQTVNMEFANGVTANLTMNAFSARCMRTSHFICTKGELICTDKTLKVCVFGKRPKTLHPANLLIPQHGEGDLRTISGFIDVLYSRLKSPDDATYIATTTESHRIVMAAEQSRLNNCPVSVETDV